MILQTASLGKPSVSSPFFSVFVLADRAAQNSCKMWQRIPPSSRGQRMKNVVEHQKNEKRRKKARRTVRHRPVTMRARGKKRNGRRSTRQSSMGIRIMMAIRLHQCLLDMGMIRDMVGELLYLHPHITTTMPFPNTKVKVDQVVP